MSPPAADLHRQFLEWAIRLASTHSASGMNGPFAALVVRNGEVISQGWNQVTDTNDPTAHAEVVAIREACIKLGTYQLAGCTLYCSCEPCPMCLGAIYWARPDKVYFASTREDAALAGFDDALIYREIMKDPSSRTIPMHHVPLQEAAQVFYSWLANPDRKMY
jgi:guanine deaminase